MSHFTFKRILPVVVVVLVLSIAVVTPASAETTITCADLDGAEVWSQESTPKYLGFFGSQYAYESIMNSYGPYGSKYQPDSVRNTYQTYGSPYSMYSAMNHLASKPPVIWRSGIAIALLTTNTYLSGWIALPNIDANCTFYSGSPIGRPAPPPPPAWFTASDGTYTDRVFVEWASVVGATEYVVGATESSDNPIQFFEPTTLTYLYITGLVPGKVYQFGVTAIGSGGYSSFVLDTGYVGLPVPAPVSLSVTLTGDGSGVVTSNPAGVNCTAGTCSAEYPQGTSVTLTASPDANFAFDGWSGGGCSGTGLCTITLNSNLVVTANFSVKPVEPVLHTLTVSKSGDGSGIVTSLPIGIDCGVTCSAQFANGTSITLLAAPSTGSSFTGWSGACSGTGQCVVAMNAAKSVTATFSTRSGPNPQYPFQQMLPAVRK